MKMALIAVLGIGLLLSDYANAADTQVLQTEKERQSYAVGVDLARNLKRQGVVCDAQSLAKGLLDEMSNGELLLSDEELHTFLAAFQTTLKKQRARPMRTVAEENRREGEAFLAENKTREGVVALPSGLQYKIVKKGNGKKPTGTDKVKINYRGTYINGTEFESSYERGQPAVFEVNGVIPGWTEALKLMPVGSTWQLFIPPHLAYGERGSGRKIGPNATLIFELELLAIE